MFVTDGFRAPLLLPAGYHLELRRCLIKGCRDFTHEIRRWEALRCVYTPSAMPTYDDYMGLLYASAYPHAYLVAVRKSACRRRVVEST